MEQSARLLTPTLSRPKLTTNADEPPEAVVPRMRAPPWLASWASSASSETSHSTLLLLSCPFILRPVEVFDGLIFFRLAAEVFDGLREQATAVSAQARGLTLRAQLLESQLPVVEERLRRRENEAHCFLQQDAAVARSNSVFVRHSVRCLCHHRPRRGSAPRKRQAGEQRHDCFWRRNEASFHRGAHPVVLRPPHLSMLDKYDAGGEGACLRRYTDPSFFRAQSAKHEHILQETSQSFRVQANAPSKRFYSFLLLSRFPSQCITLILHHPNKLAFEFEPPADSNRRI
ncbi:hypothetical protein ZWY2020_054740 [Hordeum vulgare]|nr:hypothetical protein ZWY2020_054740 [Hordeum vulgare]